MNKIWLLLKVNLLNIFGINQVLHSNNRTEKRKSYSFLLATIIGFSVLFFYLFMYCNLLIEGYQALKVPHILLVQMFVFASTFILFTTIYKANGMMFNFKDYDSIMSLPVTTKSIVISRIILTYIYNIIYNIMIMLPGFVVYVIKIHPDFNFYIMYLITLIFLPIVPMIIGSIIGSAITYFSSKFKKKSIVNIIISIMSMVIIMYISSNSNQTSIDAANLGVSLVNIFDKIYPLAKVYSDIITSNSIVSLLIYISISSLLFYLFTIVLSTNYKRLNGLITSNTTSSKFKFKKLKVSTKVNSLYKKEFKRYFASSIYVMNTGVGYILLVIACFLLITFGEEKFATFLEMPQLNIGGFIPLIIAMFVSISSTTSSSISLEGKNLWISKSLPIPIKNIFKSKVLVNLSLSIPTIMIVATIFSIYLKLNLIQILLTFTIPMLYAYLSAYLGLLINLYFPKFDYTSEVQVVKQSMASFLTVMIGMVIVIVPLAINIESLDRNIYLTIIGLIVLILNIIVKRVVDTKGIKMFEKF